MTAKNEKKLGDNLRSLKDCMDVLEKAKGIRSELRQKLLTENLETEKERKLSSELAKVTEAIEYLEKHRLHLIEQATEELQGQ